MDPPGEDDRNEALDEEDYRVLARLGYAVARAQLFEHAMLKLVEAQRHDPDIPFDERWPQVQSWLTKWTAGRIARELHVPDEIAADLRNAVARRNVVAHHAWRFYIAARARNRREAIPQYREWLEEEARVIGCAYNGLTTILLALRPSPTPLPTVKVVSLWREQVPSPIEPVSVPWPEPTPETDAEAARLAIDPP